MSQVKHWKNTAIQKSGFLSDLWDVFISYGGRAAGWILFGCMLCNIIQVIPGVTVPQAIISLVMGVQIVTLDIAGFGLNTIAKDVLKHSQDGDARETAYGAKKLASFLIGLMILTVALITIGVLYSPAKGTVDIIDKVLILARIILIVVYMHTMHDLRQVELEVQAIATQTAAANDQLLLDISQELKALTTRVNTLSVAQQKNLQSADVERMIQGFTAPFIQQVETLHSGLQLMVTGEEVEQKMKGFTASYNDQFETLQSDLHSTLQSALQFCSEDQIETLISVLLDAKMKAFNETLTTMKKTVSVTMEQSSTQRSRTSGTRAVKSAKPALAQLPAPKNTDDFDRKAFVYEALKIDSSLSIAAIKTKALQEHNAKISEGSVSKYRSLFFSELEGVSFSRNEGQNEGQNETLNEGQFELIEDEYEDENETLNDAHTDPELVAINE